MSDLEKAKTSFGTYAAHILKIDAAKVFVQAIEELPKVSRTNGPDERIGAAWALIGNHEDGGRQTVRGWALADGTVITPEKNLGRLLAEAGVWAKDAKPDAEHLAEQIVWAMGNESIVGGASVLQTWKGHSYAPALTTSADGSGSLKFLARYQKPAMGAMPAPPAVHECTIKLSADHEAQIVRGADLNRSE